MKLLLSFFVVVLLICASCKNVDSSISYCYPISAISFNDVHLTDSFWLPKVRVNQKVTIPYCFAKCEEMGRLDNFLMAGGFLKGETKGEMPFDDSDVYKIIEGASYTLAGMPDPVLDLYVDSVIKIIQMGQEEDGYLTTWKTINPAISPANWCPPGGRWENLAWSHELYNSGHLFEAAAAHYQATGKRSLLDVAIKNADLLVSVFGNGRRMGVPGHQIVETGLVKLFMLTRKQQYLELAKQFLDLRGDSLRRQTWGEYCQDHERVVFQYEAVGHAVRAVYMYAGMADIAGIYSDQSYKAALDTIWMNLVNKKLYLTGGIGAEHKGESFGDNYVLPNITAYNETCAAIANVVWNNKMFLLSGDSKYIDVLERSLYNAVISGVSLDGKSFFYPNPLECDMNFQFNRGSFTREPWFDCSCCPTSICRFMPSMPGFIFAYDNNNAYVNLYVQSNTKIALNGGEVGLSQETNYPWDGSVKIGINPNNPVAFKLHLRIPGWARNIPVPGSLYSYDDSIADDVVLKVNGIPTDMVLENGYAIINRRWNSGDSVELELPMEVRKVKTNENVVENLGKIAFERGPIVYCFEEIDNPDIDQLAIGDSIKMHSSFEYGCLGGVGIITAKLSGRKGFKAIPYFAWNNRGANKMKVWLPEE